MDGGFDATEEGRGQVLLVVGVVAGRGVGVEESGSIEGVTLPFTVLVGGEGGGGGGGGDADGHGLYRGREGRSSEGSVRSRRERLGRCCRCASATYEGVVRIISRRGGRWGWRVVGEDW